jgi:hypothetical protein
MCECECVNVNVQFVVVMFRGMLKAEGEDDGGVVNVARCFGGLVLY